MSFESPRLEWNTRRQIGKPETEFVRGGQGDYEFGVLAVPRIGDYDAECRILTDDALNRPRQDTAFDVREAGAVIGPLLRVLQCSGVAVSTRVEREHHQRLAVDRHHPSTFQPTVRGRRRAGR